MQPNVETVQGTIEAPLFRMTQQLCRLRGAGRTDAGVHSLGQVANFRTSSQLSLQRIHKGLNSLLPADISVLKAEEVPLSFDARRDNRGKHYRYLIFNRREPDVRLTPFSWRIYGPLDLMAIARAAQKLVGKHDFQAFRAADCDRETTVRTIYRCTVSRHGPLVQLDVEGTAFLKNMVRIITGTLVDIGRGHRSPEAVDAMLAGGPRHLGGPTAPPHGLTMMRVFLDA